jgi:D-amino-acid dehydrogenase
MEKRMNKKALIVGAGIVGCGIAHALLDEGWSVTLTDANEPADRAKGVPSSGNAGMIAHTDILPLASPKSLRLVPRYLSDPLGPLAIKPSYLPRLLPWLMRFLWASRPAAVERSIVNLAALQGLALPAWLNRAESLGLSRYIHRKGGLYLYDDQALFEQGKVLAERQRRFGMAIDILGAEEVRQMEPALAAGFVGAMFHADAAHISDPRDVTRAVFTAALERGASFRRDRIMRLTASPVAALTQAGETLAADAIVLAAGMWSKPLAEGLGEPVPLETERGYNVSFAACKGLVGRPLVFEGHGFIASPLESGLRIGGAVEFAGLDAPPNHARTRALHAKASRFLADVPPFEAGEAWMGFRPSTPDSLPVIGPSRADPRIVYAFGHGHYGMTQSVATGQLVADLLAGRSPPIDLSPFSIGRF